MTRAIPSDRQFIAESDARTLAEAEAIKATPSRLRPAKNAAKKLATEAQKQAAGMKKISRAPARKPTPRKVPTRRGKK